MENDENVLDQNQDNQVHNHISFKSTSAETSAGVTPVDRPATKLRIVSGGGYRDKSDLFPLTEVDVTVRLAGKLNSQRKRSITATVLLFDVASRQAIHFEELLLLWELYNSLGGGNLTRCESDKIAFTVCYCEVILILTKDSEFLGFQASAQIPQQISSWLLEQLPSKATIGSWRNAFDPSESAVLRIVRVGQHYRLQGDPDESTDRHSERYSGYSRGYDDQGGTLRKSRTRKTAELDGEEPEKVVQTWLSELRQFQAELRLAIKTEISHED